MRRAATISRSRRPSAAPGNRQDRFIFDFPLQSIDLGSTAITRCASARSRRISRINGNNRRSVSPPCAHLHNHAREILQVASKPSSCVHHAGSIQRTGQPAEASQPDRTSDVVLSTRINRGVNILL